MFNGMKVLFFKGTSSMPDIMYLLNKILIKHGTTAERYVRSKMT